MGSTTLGWLAFCVQGIEAAQLTASKQGEDSGSDVKGRGLIRIRHQEGLGRRPDGSLPCPHLGLC